MTPPMLQLTLGYRLRDAASPTEMVQMFADWLRAKGEASLASAVEEEMPLTADLSFFGWEDAVYAQGRKAGRTEAMEDMRYARGKLQAG